MSVWNPLSFLSVKWDVFLITLDLTFFLFSSLVQEYNCKLHERNVQNAVAHQGL